MCQQLAVHQRTGYAAPVGSNELSLSGLAGHLKTVVLILIATAFSVAQCNMYLCSLGRDCFCERCCESEIDVYLVMLLGRQLYALGSWSYLCRLAEQIRK